VSRKKDLIPTIKMIWKFLGMNRVYGVLTGSILGEFVAVS
jgi:hypothetical protein